MKILSLFDGMACGMLALLECGIEVERYVAYETDPHAVKTSSHNFPQIEHRGDVFEGDFTQFRGFDALIGGSPCTHWSIAQTRSRETEASGIGWELFCQYKRALDEAQPRWFVYENNKSMSQAIRKSISEAFGFGPVCINSALVSAQNRQRLYWVGVRQEDGTYAPAPVEQPEDRGILLRDVLDGAWGVGQTGGKSYAMTATYGNATAVDALARRQRMMIAEAVPSAVLNINPSGRGMNGAVMRVDAKSRCLTTNKGEGIKIIVPCEPVRIPEYGNKDKARPLGASYCHKGCGEGSLACDCFPDDPNKQVFDYVSEPIWTDNVNDSGQGPYAIPVAFDGEIPTHAVSGADGKTYPVYRVEGGYITVKGQRYPIKLSDGWWIIRKLTVSECKRLQTVPEWYEFPVSNTQAYKLLGNGWTVEVIAHLIRAIMEGERHEDR